MPEKWTSEQLSFSYAYSHSPPPLSLFRSGLCVVCLCECMEALPMWFCVTYCGLCLCLFHVICMVFVLYM
jgi:hypothetical protein